ncbi:serine/threonine protein kinase [Candidatus Woesearchaeota archaeon]|nr:serine/threonine protein kinase [Candidatus Woesearchaeota archaeon]
MSLDEELGGIEGTRIGPENRYYVGREIGQSSFKKVFMAHDEVFDLDVVLKFYRVSPIKGTIAKSSDHNGYDALSNMVDEARLLAMIDSAQSTNVLNTFRYNNEVPVLVEKYIRGLELERVVNEFPNIPELAIINMGLDLTSALAVAHSKGILHGDLKADNIVVIPTSEESFSTKLIDFGIWDPQGSTIRTRAPEVIMGGEYTELSEIYALGAVLYYASTGQYPHLEGLDKDTDREIIKQRRVSRKPIPPRKLSRGISRGFQRVVMKALHKNPSKRYQSVLALRKALNGVKSSGSRMFGDFLRGYPEQKDLEFFIKHLNGQLAGASYEDMEAGFQRYRRRQKIISRIVFGSIPIITGLFLTLGPMIVGNVPSAKFKRINEDYNRTYDIEFKAYKALFECYGIRDPYKRLEGLRRSFQLYVSAEEADRRYINYLNRLRFIKTGMEHCYHEMSRGQYSPEQQNKARGYIKEAEKVVQGYKARLSEEFKRDSSRNFDHLR